MGRAVSNLAGWVQLTFDFGVKQTEQKPKARTVRSKIRAIFIPDYCLPKDRCKQHGCDRRASKGKAYCSKAHSPYGLLADEPDNAPIEWMEPEPLRNLKPYKLRVIL